MTRPTLAAEFDYLDVDVAYLLGLITARGQFFEQGGVHRLAICFPYRKQAPSVPQGFSLGTDFETAYRLALDDARNRLDELLGEPIQVIATGNEVTFTVTFTRRTMVWRNLRCLTDNAATYNEFVMPPVILETKSSDLKREFLKGFADAGAVPSIKDSDQAGRHRISIQVQHNNWTIPVQICRLLQCGLGVPVQHVLWGHPNVRSPQGGGGWAKEHRIRIYADNFLPVGFGFGWKQEILEQLARINLDAFGPSPKGLCSPRLGKRSGAARKPTHPHEGHKSLPDCVRGRHFDSSRGICRRVGCRQRHGGQTSLIENDQDA